ncbi:hypothetical protein SUGI_0637320 [Cryptomeria japonica]|uniref:protein NRT1/ PTR FAMILY 4.5 n=1 Tax=Cryptomeria japonica TaxID=3369 RepID=UPI002414B372|nr:protein NRT1/ PTR FAMILY 4.5 [Cryptomeria japonica]GLJ31703.1 hypothetical protein SUGI_0637320 [Cryptomeria japonica]
METERGEAHQLEEYVDWRNKHVDKPKHGGILAAAFVFLSETFENLAFLANATNFVNYFYGFMHFSLSVSANTVTNFIGTSFLLPLLGAFMCDTFTTTYVTVIIFAVVELLGWVLLTVQAHFPSLKPPACDMGNPSNAGICKQVEGGQALMLYTGLYLVALGVGGIKGSLPVHGVEQFDENDGKERKLRSNFFNWFLFSMCVGSLLAVTFVVWVQDNKGWFWGFVLSILSIALVLAFFLSYTRRYRNRIPIGSPLTCIAQVFVAAIRKRRLNPNDIQYQGYESEPTKVNSSHLHRTPQFRFLEKASVVDPSAGGAESPWRLCTVSQVEEVKIMMRILPIFASTIMMNCCIAQLQTFSIRQATTMKTTINDFKVPPASLPAIPVISMIILIPIYDRAFVPLARRLTGKETGISHLQRVGVGLVLSIISMAVAASMEIKRKKVARHYDLIDSSQPLPVTFLWVGIQYFVLGIADMFALAGLMEFFYSQAPCRMRSMATALSWVSISMGYYLSSVLVSIVNGATRRFGDGVGWLSGNNLNRNHLDRFYWLLCFLSALNFVNYLLWSVWYTYKR